MNIHVGAEAFARFEARRLSPAIGAELHGIDLSQPMDEVMVTEIREALLRYKVIFFRNQSITRSHHIEFARKFGELEIHPATPKDQEDPEVLRITHNASNKGQENAWHSDVTWRTEPSLGSVLRAVELPQVGGDTLFSDMVMAYEGLSEKMKEFCCGLTAVHDIARVFAKRLGKDPKELHAKFRPQEHPVIRTHPETGERLIYVNTAFTSHIKDLSEKESDWLLQHLYSQAAVPEYQCRFRWEVGSIAFWDNRACQHYAASDYFPDVRVMERVTIAGDRPYFAA